LVVVVGSERGEGGGGEREGRDETGFVGEAVELIGEVFPRFRGGDVASELVGVFSGL
jgi:hypothetical protein